MFFSIKLPGIHKCCIFAVSPYRQACLLGGHLGYAAGIETRDCCQEQMLGGTLQVEMTI